jgi:phage repressor protein C with HTH and peptisase S24 domain
MLHAPVPGFTGRHGNRIEPPDPAKPAHGDFTWDGEEFQMIARMDLSVSAGHGLMPVDDGARESIAVSRRWLLANSINGDLSVLVRVKGDSMAPAIPDGALVLVHAAEMRLAVEGVYAFTRGDSAFIKRLIPVAKGADGRPTSLVILADNPAYPPETLSGPAMNDLRVVGRVRCVLTTL